MRKITRTLTLLTLALIGARNASADPGLAAQAARAPEGAPRADQAMPPAAEAEAKTQPRAYAWEALLEQANRPEPASAPEAAITPPTAPSGATPTVEESPAQRYHRVVEDSRAYLPPQPVDYLGRILRRHEAQPWPTGAREDDPETPAKSRTP